MYSPDRILAPSGLELRRQNRGRGALARGPQRSLPDSGTSQVQILQADPGEQTPCANPPTMAEKSPNLRDFSSRPRGILDYFFF